MSPGTWLSDMTQERYEVREKKTSKKVLLNLLPFNFRPKVFRVNLLFVLIHPIWGGDGNNRNESMRYCCLCFWQRPRGLKAMGNVDSDSD